MTTWFERRPGSEETLLALYDSVVGAEELDLEEQVREEAFWAEVHVWYGLPSDGADGLGDMVGGSDEDNDEGDRVSMSQAVGIIEHLLGGRPLPDGGQSAV